MFNWLVDLYKIHSPSFQEKELSEYVENFLIDNEIEYDKTEDYQLYYIKPNTPMICAHMDQVGTVPTTNIYTLDKYIFGDTNIGADDKNGVFILMNLLLHFKNEISFIFSTGEESGCNIDNVFKKLTGNEIDSIKYCIVFDRQKNGDIIGWLNNYCNKDLEDDIAKIGEKYNFKTTSGLISDCDIIALNEIPCVNLSCGYYFPHLDSEFTDIEELYNTYQFGFDILTNLDSYYTRVEYTQYFYENYFHGSRHSSYVRKNYKDHVYYEKKRPKPLSKNTISMDDPIAKCILCDFVFLQDEINDSMCPICKNEVQKYSNSKNNEIQSEEEYNGEELYCRYCDRTFSIDNTRIDSTLRCPICDAFLYIDYYMLIASGLIDHNYVEESSFETVFICCSCGRTSVHKRNSEILERGICSKCKGIMYMDTLTLSYDIINELLFEKSSVVLNELYCPACDEYYDSDSVTDICPVCHSTLLITEEESIGLYSPEKDEMEVPF